MRSILFLTCHLPFPLISGGRRREFELLSRLASRFDVHLVAVSKTYEEDLGNAERLKGSCASVTVLPASAGEAASEPFQVRRHQCAEARPEISRIIEAEHIDLLHVEAFYMMQHVPEGTALPIFLQEQNVEYLLWKQRAEIAHDPEERKESLWQYLRTVESEKEAWRKATMLGAITREELDTMRAALPHKPVRLVPDGFDHLCEADAGPAPAETFGNTVSFIANFAYQPNVDAAVHLLADIWPTVAAKVPAARLVLVGNAPPRQLFDMAAVFDNVTLTGRVPDVTPWVDSADVIACPLRVGGGVKVKVLEGLCRGKAVVTTSIGAQGIPRANEIMKVADRSSKFALEVVDLLRRPSERRRLETAALNGVLGLPTWEHAASALVNCYEELLGNPPVPAPERSGAITQRA